MPISTVPPPKLRFHAVWLGWDKLAWESKIADEDGFGVCTTH